MKLSEILPQLTAKFPPEAHKERELPGTTQTWWYVPWQTIRARLNEVCPDDWEVSYDEPKYLDKYCYVTCTLMICGVTRRAIGSAPIELISSKGKNMARGNPIERAVADAFKNACEAFGIAAYLDEQSDDRTKVEFVRYMQRAGYGKPAAQYQTQQRIANGEAPAPKPSSSPKPFGQPQPTRQQQANDTRPISEEQRKRFWAIAKQSGYSDDAVKLLIGAFGFTSTTAITRNAYDSLCEKAADPELKEVYNDRAAGQTQQAS